MSEWEDPAEHTLGAEILLLLQARAQVRRYRRKAAKSNAELIAAHQTVAARDRALAAMTEQHDTAKMHAAVAVTRAIHWESKNVVLEGHLAEVNAELRDLRGQIRLLMAVIREGPSLPMDDEPDDEWGRSDPPLPVTIDGPDPF